MMPTDMEVVTPDIDLDKLVDDAKARQTPRQPLFPLNDNVGMVVVQQERIKLVEMRIELAKFNIENRLVEARFQFTDGPRTMDETIGRREIYGLVIELESTLRTMVELGLITRDRMQLELIGIKTHVRPDTKS